MADIHPKPTYARFKDIEGQRFGQLLVKQFLYVRPGHGAFWLCLCDCGTEKAVRSTHLQSGNTKTCGCRGGFWRHGKNGSKVYRAWQGMIQRCHNTKHGEYKNYGARGITVCKQWHDFVVFYHDMGDPPAGHSLDRIDNDGNYEPGNCRWATPAEQSRNSRQNHMLSFQGRTQCLTDWAREVGLRADTLRFRLSADWPLERALTEAAGAAGGDDEPNYAR